MSPAWKSAKTCLRSFRQLNRSVYLQPDRHKLGPVRNFSHVCDLTKYMPHMLIMLYEGKMFASHVGLISCLSHVNKASISKEERMTFARSESPFACTFPPLFPPPLPSFLPPLFPSPSRLTASPMKGPLRKLIVVNETSAIDVVSWPQDQKY